MGKEKEKSNEWLCVCVGGVIYSYFGWKMTNETGERGGI